VGIVTGRRLTRIVTEPDGRLTLHFQEGGSQTFDRVAVTTGGSPRTEGLHYLETLGHSLVPSVPSLFTFNISDRRFTALMGTVVEQAIVSLPSTRLTASGPLLITHWGMSGPAVLKLSSHAAPLLRDHDYRMAVAVNWVGETSRSEGGGTAGRHGRRPSPPAVGHPAPLCSAREAVAVYPSKRRGFPPGSPGPKLGKKGMNKLIETLTHDLYHTAGKATCREEFVTCGGVGLDNIDYNTLESKRCPNLYFAGEVLDVDAVTGGFNLQAAWTMGYVVGQHIANTPGHE
jgi:predicted Rossmann fold flavoprotein